MYDDGLKQDQNFLSGSMFDMRIEGQEIRRIIEGLRIQFHLFYIEVPVIVPVGSELYFPLKVSIREESFTLASYGIRFNLQTGKLKRRGHNNLITYTRGINLEHVEAGFLYIQLSDEELFRSIERFLDQTGSHYIKGPFCCSYNICMEFSVGLKRFHIPGACL